MNVISLLCFQGYFDFPLTITKWGIYQNAYDRVLPCTNPCWKRSVCVFYMYVHTCIHLCALYFPSSQLHIFHCLIQLTYSQPVVNQSFISVGKDANKLTSVTINGIVGIHTSLRHCLPICYSLRPTYPLMNPFCLPVSPWFWQLGSTYMGCFQACDKRQCESQDWMLTVEVLCELVLRHILLRVVNS